MITQSEAISNILKAGKELAEVLEHEGISMTMDVPKTGFGFHFDVASSHPRMLRGAVSLRSEPEVPPEEIAEIGADSAVPVEEPPKTKKRTRRSKKQIAEDKLKEKAKETSETEPAEALEEALGDIDLTSDEPSSDDDPLNDLSGLEDGFSDDSPEEEPTKSGDVETSLDDDLDGLLD